MLNKADKFVCLSVNYIIKERLFVGKKGRKYGFIGESLFWGISGTVLMVFVSAGTDLTVLL